jgi:hypothetical protein
LWCWSQHIHPHPYLLAWALVNVSWPAGTLTRACLQPPAAVYTIPDKPNYVTPASQPTEQQLQAAHDKLATLANVKHAEQLPTQVHILPLTSNMDYGFWTGPATVSSSGWWPCRCILDNMLSTLAPAHNLALPRLGWLISANVRHNPWYAAQLSHSQPLSSPFDTCNCS